MKDGFVISVSSGVYSRMLNLRSSRVYSDDPRGSFHRLCGWDIAVAVSSQFYYVFNGEEVDC